MHSGPLDVDFESSRSPEKSVRGALLAKGPDSSMGEAHKGLAPN